MGICYVPRAGRSRAYDRMVSKMRARSRGGGANQDTVRRAITRHAAIQSCFASSRHPGIVSSQLAREPERRRGINPATGCRTIRHHINTRRRYRLTALSKAWVESKNQFFTHGTAFASHLMYKLRRLSSTAFLCSVWLRRGGNPERTAAGCWAPLPRDGERPDFEEV